LQKINHLLNDFSSDKKDKIQIIHPLQQEIANNKNNFDYNNLDTNLEAFDKYKIKRINNQIYPNSINSDINNRIKNIRNERRRIKNKMKSEWTRMNDIKLIELIEIYNLDWPKIASIMNISEDLIKQRYEKRLDPKLKFTKFTEEEDNALMNLYKIYGSTWNYISKFFPNRTPIMIKNRFYSSLKKRILTKKKVDNDNDNDLKNVEVLVKEFIPINSSFKLEVEEKKEEIYVHYFQNQDSPNIRNLKGAYKCEIKEMRDLISSSKIPFEDNKSFTSKTVKTQNNKVDFNDNTEKNKTSIANSESNLTRDKEFYNLNSLSKKSLLLDKNNQEAPKTIDNQGIGNIRKSSLNELIYKDIDSLSVKSSYFSFFEKKDILNKEKSIRESDEIKIFSNLNKPINAYVIDENYNNAFEKIKTNIENDSNYSSLVNELLDNNNINFDINKDFSFLNSETLSEKCKLAFY